MTASTLAAPAAPRGRAVNMALWIVQILLAVLFVFGGVNKLFSQQQEVAESFARIGLGTWFRYFTGAVELAGGIGLLIPRLSALAALGLAGVMIGAAIAHLTVLPPAFLAAIPAVLVVVFCLIARARWPQTRALIEKLRG